MKVILYLMVDFEKKIWWQKDLEETLRKIYRQGNDNSESDFADSELLLQDFINRYVDPKSESPMKPYSIRQLISVDAMS